MITSEREFYLDPTLLHTRKYDKINPTIEEAQYSSTACEGAGTIDDQLTEYLEASRLDVSAEPQVA